jgi:hypothetical protein
MAFENSYPFDKVSGFTKFLWWCAGADKYFLMKSPKQDRVKYAGIGGIVLSTGILAVFAGYIAFKTAFGPKGMAGEELLTMGWKVLFGFAGVIWGIIIFNMDRFIVSSTGKGDGTDKIDRKELINAIPRVLIAIILGITISKPLELEMLKSEIDVKLNTKQQEQLDEFNKNTYAKFKEQIAIIDADVLKLENDRNVLVQRQKEAEKEYIDQMQGRSGSQGYGPRAKQLEVLKDEKQKEIDEFDLKHAVELSNLKNQRNQKLADQEKELNVDNLEKAKGLDGLLERISIAHEIGFWLGIALMFVFFAIEMGPIFFKMMMNKGPYDYMVENFNYRMQVKNGIVKEERIYEGTKGIMLMEKVNYLEVENDRLEKEEKLRAQAALSKKVVGIWSSEKMKEIDDQPVKFYKESEDTNTEA